MKFINIIGLASIQGLNVQDKSHTIISLSSVKNDPSEFLVNVIREDNLINKYNQTLAARLMAVSIRFHIENNSVIYYIIFPPIIYFLHIIKFKS